MSEESKRKKITYDSGFRLADGYYNSYVLYNPETKKNERFKLLKPTKILEEAKKARRNTEIKMGIAQTRAQRRFEFLQKFNNQEALFEKFTQHRKKAAKRSWKEEISRLNCYVFPFFIGKMNLNHPALWFEYWQEFQDSLNFSIRSNTKAKNKLTVNTKDNIIRAANSFISFVEMTESGSPLKRLPEFKFEEKEQRGIESVYTDDEILAVHQEFLSLRMQKYADLWKLLSTTGMRVGEAIGLMHDDIAFNRTPAQEKWIFTALKDKTDMFGYILLKSQPFDVNHLVLNGEVKRSPLKKRKKIAPQYNRVIPLIDKDTALILQRLKKQVTTFGLLFEGCSYREFYKVFAQIREKLKLDKHKDIHSVRHTFATKFTKLCDGDPRLAEKVLGHSDPKMTARYNHLANEMETLANSSNDDEIKPLKIG